LGAIHGPSLGSLSLDNLPNLNYGSTYRMDVFFCERHSPGSKVRMVTNLPMSRPRSAPVVSWKRNYGMMD
jgi:fibro-slime domain-containing protein